MLTRKFTGGLSVGKLVGVAVGIEVLTGVGVGVLAGVDVLTGVGMGVLAGVDVLTGVLVGVGVEMPGAARVLTEADCSMTVSPNWFNSVSVSV